MKINWKIDYTYKTAECSQMVVSLAEGVPVESNFGIFKATLGFAKQETGKEYTVKVLYVSQEFVEKLQETPQLLANYMSQLGDTFNEYEWIYARKKDVLNVIGKKPTQKDLAKYLNVTDGAVSQYSHDKKELMIYGLWVQKELQKGTLRFEG